MFYRFFFFKQKTAYELRISDWSSDVCSSDLRRGRPAALPVDMAAIRRTRLAAAHRRRRARLLREHRPDLVGPVEDDVGGPAPAIALLRRTEERRVGKECVSNLRSRWSPVH